MSSFEVRDTARQMLEQAVIRHAELAAVEARLAGYSRNYLQELRRSARRRSASSELERLRGEIVGLAAVTFPERSSSVRQARTMPLNLSIQQGNE